MYLNQYWCMHADSAMFLGGRYSINKHCLYDNSKPKLCLCALQDYTITMYLNQYWRDERLQFSPDDNESLTLTGDFAERIWVPDTFLANDKSSFLHDVTEKNKMVRLFGNGSLVYGMR